MFPCSAAETSASGLDPVRFTRPMNPRRGIGMPVDGGVDSSSSLVQTGETAHWIQQRDLNPVNVGVIDLNHRDSLFWSLVAGWERLHVSVAVPTPSQRKTTRARK